MHFYIYIKQKQSQNVYIYIQKARHFAKAVQFALRFYSQKAGHFRLREFILFSIGIYLYPKVSNFALRDVTFLYKPNTFPYAIFHVIFEIGGGGGHFYEHKTMHFLLNFYIPETMHFLLRFCIQKATQFAWHFYILKTMHFALR